VSSRCAWLLVGLTLVCAVGQSVVLVSFQPLFSLGSYVEGWPLIPAATVAGAYLGALVVRQRPGHPVGWLLITGQCITAVGMVATAVGARAAALEPSRPADIGHVAQWVGTLLSGTTGLQVTAAVFLLVPHGRLPSSRWRPALVCCGAALLVHTAAVFTIAPVDLDAGGHPVSPSALTANLYLVGNVLTIAALAAGAASLVVRLRRAEGEARRQLLWVALPAGTLAVGLLVLWLWDVVVGPPDGAALVVLLLPVFLGWAALPVCAGIAVLRHRLFDIELVVSRAVVLTVATGFVSACYVAVVVVLGSLPGVHTESVWPTLSATVIAALAFQPLRRRVIRFADRLTYGRRAAPYEALADFSARLTQSPTPEELLTATAAAAGTSVSAQHATATLHLTTPQALGATWSATPPSGRPCPLVRTDVAIRDRGESLGHITVSVQAGRDLRAGDRRLLTDLADHAALAFRNAKLESELAASVAALDRRTRDLTRSRLRLVQARDSERLRIERAITDDVLPRLTDLSARLEMARSTAERGTPPDLEPLVDRAMGALEELRRVSHGIFPVELSRAGLGPALRTLVSRVSPVPTVELDSTVRTGRFDPEVEAAVYFCCSEAVRTCTGPLTVRLSHRDACVDLFLDGLSPRSASSAPDEHLESMVDRVEAVGGWASLDDGPTPTSLRALVPAPAVGAGTQDDVRAQQRANPSGPKELFGTYAAAPQPRRSNSPAS
jgi:signal transduction histidine kinase